MAQPSTLSPPGTQAAAPPVGLLAVLLTGVFIAVLDTSIVNVAIPRIGLDFDASGAELQLVVAGYTIAYAVLLITGARLGDLLGRRRMFLLGAALFTVASLACGVAWSIGTLIGFRVAEGVGAALMVPQVMSLIQGHYSGGARVRALGRYGATISGGAVVGQISGGLLVTANLFGSQWRPVFLINVPIGAVLLVAGGYLLPRDAGRPGRVLDLAGVLTLSAAVLALVVPLVLGHEVGWAPWTWASFGAFAVLASVFVVVERRAERRDASPLVHGTLLRSRGMVPGALAILVSLANYGGSLFMIAVFVQAGLGRSALVAGLAFLPSAVMFGVISLNWRRLPARWHRRMIPAGLLLAALGFVGLAFAARGGHVDTGMEFAIGCVGTGMGLAFSPLFAFALAHVPPAHAADASGVLTTVNQLGQVIGVAAYGSIYLGRFHSAADAPHAGFVTSLVMAVGGAVAAAVSLRLPE